MPPDTDKRIRALEEQLENLNNRGSLPYPLDPTSRSVFEREFDVLYTKNQTVFFEAGEQLDATDAVFYAPAAADVNALVVADDAGGIALEFGTATNRLRYAQSFRETQGMTVSKITVSLKKNNSPTDNVRVGIQEESGTTPGAPSGTYLSSGTVAGSSLTTSFASYTITLDADVITQKSKRYLVVLERTGASSDTDTYLMSYDSGATLYANGIASFQANNGVWSDRINDSAITLITRTVADRIYRTSASAAAQVNSFVGFVKNAVSFRDQAVVYVTGHTPGFSGLTKGTQYYLSNTRGAIATSAGSTTRKVGIASSSTEILITNIW